jgi:hypothetical protein
MALFGRKSKNLLERVPVRRVDHVPGEQAGRVTLHVPRFTSRLAMRLFGGMNKRPLVSMRLDEIGTFVWLQMDGVRTLAEIGDLLEQKFGERAAQAHQRVALFARTLHRDGLIEWKRP